MRKTGIAVSLLLITFIGSALDAQEGPAYMESVEVRIANVDVVVTTKDGRRVEGLRASDFELKDNGVPQTITNFYEVRPRATEAASAAAGAAASAPGAAVAVEQRRRRFVVFFVDLYSLSPRRRNEALAALQQFATTNLRDGDQAMLAVWNHRLIVPVPFTADVFEVVKQFGKLSASAGGGLSNDKKIVEMRVKSALQEAEVAGTGRNPFAAAYGVALGYVGNYAIEQWKMTRNMEQDLEELFRGIAGVDGKKVVVLVGENFPSLPAAPEYQYVNEIFNPYAGQISRFVVPQIIAGRNSNADLPIRLSRAANANDITIHALYSGENGDQAGAEQDDPEEGSIAARFMEFSDTGQTLAAVTRDTGGIAVIGSHDFKRAASEIARDLDNYYSLAYRVDPKLVGERRIEVHTKNPQFVVRTRRALAGKSLDQEIVDRTASTLLVEQAPKGEGMQITAGRPVRSGRNKIRVPVDIAFSSSFLTLLDQAGKKAGGFDVLVAAGDNENRLSEVRREKQDVAWSGDAVPKLITYHLEAVVRDRPGMIAVSVVDRLSKTVIYGRTNVPKK